MHVQEDTIDSALIVHNAIDEFTDSPKQEKSDFEERYADKEHIILVAYEEDIPIGYIVAYDRDSDGSIYCWMAAVHPKHRQKGVLTQMMDTLESWAKNHEYKTLKIKTRNNRRQMLHYLVKNDFILTEIEQKEDRNTNRIHAEKPL